MTTTISKDTVFPYGEENAVASFYKWLSDTFHHPTGYPVYFDKDMEEFENRSLVNFPCIVAQQIDTQDLTQQYIGGKHNKMELLFYVYFNHHIKEGGTRRLLRRGRDQIMFALKMAGQTQPDGTYYADPILLYDFSSTPITQLDSVLTVKSGIQQRFIQDGELLQFEAMLTLQYIEKLA